MRIRDVFYFFSSRRDRVTSEDCSVSTDAICTTWYKLCCAVPYRAPVGRCVYSVPIVTMIYKQSANSESSSRSSSNEVRLQWPPARLQLARWGISAIAKPLLIVVNKAFGYGHSSVRGQRRGASPCRQGWCTPDIIVQI